jgi:hypothetical protein
MTAVAIANHAAGPAGGHPGIWPFVVVLGTILGFSVTMWFLGSHDRPDDDSGEDGHGGPPPDPPPTPRGPSWWPQFERDFAAYAAAVGPRRPRDKARAP